MVPDIGIQRPGVGHHDGAAGAPVSLTKRLGAVPGLDLDGTAHGLQADCGKAAAADSGGKGAKGR